MINDSVFGTNKYQIFDRKRQNSGRCHVEKFRENFEALTVEEIAAAFIASCVIPCR
jgi:hypothetical protein